MIVWIEEMTVMVYHKKCNVVVAAFVAFVVDGFPTLFVLDGPPFVNWLPLPSFSGYPACRAIGWSWSR